MHVFHISSIDGVLTLVPASNCRHNDARVPAGQLLTCAIICIFLYRDTFTLDGGCNVQSSSCTALRMWGAGLCRMYFTDMFKKINILACMIQKPSLKIRVSLP